MEIAYYNLLYDVLKAYDRCTPSKIVNLRNNQIFVFGTNKYGSQKHGAAGLAAKSFGAQVGITNGPTGMCYALPTMGFDIVELGKAILQFEQFARKNRDKTFLVTPIGCGHAGFKVEDVAPFFKGCVALKNVMLPDLFVCHFRQECIEKLKLKNSSNNLVEENNVYSLYEQSVHPVLDYLIKNSIKFSLEGGFTLLNEQNEVVAEAELGIESEKVVFLPFGAESEKAFIDAGYMVCDVNDYLNSKYKP
jgi:hypothetical protein